MKYQQIKVTQFPHIPSSLVIILSLSTVIARLQRSSSFLSHSFFLGCNFIGNTLQ